MNSEVENLQKRSLTTIALFILLVQPVLVGLGTPETIELVSDRLVSAQDPGFRVDPGDLTEHVPIEIDGTNDFVSQGWPGSGTPGDPYLIAELNITQDLGKYMISIVNTNASFIIRDCFLGQQFLEWAIRLENTTAATIEYMTVDSARGGIYCNNANNTRIEHCDIISHTSASDVSYAVSLLYSIDCAIENNRLESQYRVVRGYYSHFLNLTGNTVYGDSGWYTYRLEYCNYTKSIMDTVNSGYDLYIYYCHFLTFDQFTMEASGGVRISEGSHIEIKNSHVDSSGGTWALNIIASPFVHIQDSFFSAAANGGILIQICDNVSVTGCIVEDAGGSGISITNLSNVTISSCFVSNVISYGLNLGFVQNATITDNTITDTVSRGFSSSNSDNVTFVNNAISYAGDDGFYATPGDNWTITDNSIEYVDGYGLYHYNGENVICQRNSVSYGNDDGIRIDSDPDALITDNTVHQVDGYGLSVSSCDRTLIQANVVDDASDGLYIDSCVNATITDNVVTDVSYSGISLYDMETSVIDANSVDANARFGMQFDLMDDCNITNNVLTGSGFYWAPDLPIGYYEHLFEGNTVNGMDVYYQLHDDGQNIIAGDWAQIFLINCTNMDIHDGTFNHITVPIELIHSDTAHVWDIVSFNNAYGLYIYNSENATIHDIEISGTSYSDGIMAYYAHGLSLFNATIENCYSTLRYALRLRYSDSLAIQDCVFDNNYVGIRMDEGLDVLIDDSEILNSASYGIQITGGSSEYIRILNNLVLNATTGIYVGSADNVSISENIVRYCSSTGVWYGGSSITALNLTLNIIENNDDGVVVSNNGPSLVSNNTIRWNSGYGIYVDNPATPDIYYNIIALNRLDNGEDETAGNDWDDGVDTGNWWDDYTPPGVYNVDGNTQDNYPMLYLPTEPIIDQPNDVYYAEGSTGNYITWYPYDDYLKEWEATIDGSFWDADAWNYDSVTVNIDGLDYGTHTVVVTVRDMDLNTVTDTVLVHVYDGTAPKISNTANTVAFVDGTGQTLSWEVSDLHPDTYTAYLDGEEWDSGSWTTGTLNVNIDGMTEGEHAFKVVIKDMDGNAAYDTVTILVVDDDVSPTIDSPQDVTYRYGSTNNRIVWTPSDKYPDWFEVAYNSSILVEGSWGGARILVNVDGLDVGSHEFTITVYDGSGNSISDSVTVTVLPAGDGGAAVPLDLGAVMLIVAGVAAVAVVVVVIWMLRKQGRI
jgi:parallel beta-helix repeat protein